MTRSRRRSRSSRREFWSPATVVLCGLIAAFGVAVVVLAVYVVATELVGSSPTGEIGIARRAPVWLAWIACLLAVLGGLNLAVDNLGYLVRVARGRVPRLRPPR